MLDSIEVNLNDRLVFLQFVSLRLQRSSFDCLLLFIPWQKNKNFLVVLCLNYVFTTPDSSLVIQNHEEYLAVIRSREEMKEVPYTTAYRTELHTQVHNVNKLH